MKILVIVRQSQKHIQVPCANDGHLEIPLPWLWSLRNAVSFNLAFSWCLLGGDKSENASDNFFKAYKLFHK